MKTYLVAWFISPLLFGTATYLYFATDSALPRWFSDSDPKLEMVDFFDFGERELGEIIRSRLTIANRGNKELFIDEIKSGCSCTWLEREENSRATRIESLQIDPGTSVELFLCLQVRVNKVGSPIRAVITFRTNDPGCPEARIEAYISKVKGGITAWPSPISFGTVRMGGKARQVIEIQDHAIHSRTVERVVSSDPDSIAVRLLPIDRDQVRSESLIARYEVVLRARKIGPIQEKITIYLADEDRPPDVVPITAKVVEPIELLPAVVVLPRVSSNQSLYHAECSCRVANGETLSLVAHSIPSDLQVKVFPGLDPNTQYVRIEWIPRRSDHAETKLRTVQLAARIGKEKALVEIPVMALPAFEWVIFGLEGAETP